MFFKRFTLVPTIVVLVMIIDYAPVLRSAAGHASNLGEFFSLPLLTCAGLMYLVSAIAFIFIFVPLDVVTICFFRLVVFPGQTAVALEAAVSSLIPSALSTASLVYDITAIFGGPAYTPLPR